MREPGFPRNNTTIYDVAAKAGVSISTVSLALNNPSRVRGETLARVMAAVDELGFVPKHHAVTRARQGVGRIGVVAPFTSFASFGLRLNGVLRVAMPEGLEVVVYDEESAAKSRLMSLPVTQRIDGLIVMSMPLDDPVAGRLIEQGVPTVLVELGHPRFSSVTVDNAAGGQMVAALFTARGHERCAYVGHVQNYDYASQSASRFDGFRAGLAFPPEVVLVEHTFAAARSAALDLLSTPKRPTAVFAHSDILASGVLAAARGLSISVPEELAIVGFDDSEIAEPLGLSVVRQPLEESGEIATQTLLTQLTNPDATIRNTTLALTLIERDTT